MEVKPITKEEAIPFVKNKHYAETVPVLQKSIGLLHRGGLVGICTFGPPPRMLNDGYGLFGGEIEIETFELNRLVTNDELPNNSTSFFVSSCFDYLPNPSCIVAYANPNHGHHGYIYQATNWTYIGLTTDTIRYYNTESEEYVHARSIVRKYGQRDREFIESELEHIEIREQKGKHRYVYFVGNKRQKRRMEDALTYEEKPYPKGDNEKYDASYKPVTQNKLF